MSELEPGDVIQVKPNQRAFGGCFAVVVAIRSWGVTASCRGPRASGPAEYPMRLARGDYERIGRPAWIQDDLVGWDRRDLGEIEPGRIVCSRCSRIIDKATARVFWPLGSQELRLCDNCFAEATGPVPG